MVKVAVLMGGVSSEREISIKSGKAVATALRQIQVDVTEIDIKTENMDELGALDCDVAFLALHGRFGEDGKIQKILEDKNIPYTGSGPLASRFAMDKLSAKLMFMFHKIPTPDFIFINNNVSEAKTIKAIEAFGMPIVIKPREEGSSFGVTIAGDIEQAMNGIREAKKYHPDTLIERYIKGTELTVAILHNSPLPVITPTTQRQFFDYYAKYIDPSTLYVVDPPIPQEIKKAAMNTALFAHNALKCYSFSRVDIIVSDRPYVLEVNTIPGLTERSLLPMAAKHAGIDFPDLCLQIVKTAIKRHKLVAT